jgi:hypothetical protein
MCQIIPYTLPCCRRAYVLIAKLPSCDDSWPRKKCPAELCIQIYGIKPQERATGNCWRCVALVIGKSGVDREGLRPAIDSARVSISLEEFSPGQRRKRVEMGGHCWFCDARSGCKECGTVEIVPVSETLESQSSPSTPLKRDGHLTGFTRQKNPVKRLKREHGSTPSFSPTYENNQHYSDIQQVKIGNDAPIPPLAPESVNWHPSYAVLCGYHPAVWGMPDESSSIAIDPTLLNQTVNTQDNNQSGDSLPNDYFQSTSGMSIQTRVEI